MTLRLVIAPVVVALGAGAAGAAVLPALPWELVVVVASLAMSWGVQVTTLNGYGKRQDGAETRLAQLEGKTGNLDILNAGFTTLDRRLERIEALLDAQVRISSR